MISALLAGIAAMVALFGVIGQLGRFSDIGDVVNFVAPWWLTIGVVAGAASFAFRPIRRARRTAGLSLLLLGELAGLLLGPDLYARATAPVCTGPELGLVQFNLYAANPDPRPAAAWINGTNADIVLIEEVVHGSPILPLLRARYPHMLACLPHMRCSTMILTRAPLVASGTLAKADPDNRKGLSALWADVSSPAGPVTIVAAHLARPWPWAGNSRDRADLTRFVATRDRRAMIMAGDFNLPAWTFQMRGFAERLKLRRLTSIPSWPVTRLAPPFLAIDHVFVGKDWSAAGIERGPPLGSDHYPLFARVRRCGGSA